MGRQAVTMEIGSTILDDSEIRELSTAATSSEELDKRDVGVVGSEAAQTGTGGSLGL